MKNIKILLVFPVILAGLTGCKNKKNEEKSFDWNVYHNDVIYSAPTYEQIDIAKDGTAPYNIVLQGVPEEGIPQTRWDDYDIKLHCWYNDGTQQDIPFKEVNIPIKDRHLLAEIGTHEFDLGFSPMPRKWEFKIIENKNWNGFKCYFFDGSNTLIHTQTVGYYENVVYNGPAIEPVDALEIQYRFTKWNQSLNYVNQDMQLKALYKSVEKRDYARKPADANHKFIGSVIDKANQKGSTNIYLGRLQGVAGIYSNIEYLGGSNIHLQVPNTDFGKYWNEMNKVVQDHILYREVDSKVPYFQGSVANMLTSLNYNTVMDDRFSYPKDTTVKLVDNVDATLSANDPYDNVLTRINPYIGKVEVCTVGSKDSGYYRIAILFDVDVYLTYSYRRISEGAYELDVHNALTISPVIGTCRYVLQTSETEEFKDSFNTYFEIDTETLWNYANAQNWNE